MNKLKKIGLAISKKMLGFKYVVSEKWYVKSVIKYYKRFGVNFTGKPKYIARDVKMDSSNPSLITIGEGSVITAKVTILVHDYSVECGLTAIGKEDADYEAISFREVRIGNNVFIGQNTFVCPGADIGDNCIIGAGSVVRGKVPADSILAGNPAVIVGKTSEWAEKKYKLNQYQRGSKRRK